MTDYRYEHESRELWQLDVHTDRVYQAALGWKWLAENLRTRLDNLQVSDERLRGSDWSGETRDAFDVYRTRIANTIEGAAQEADSLHDRVNELADEATDRQEQLNQNLYQILRYEKVDESTPTTFAFRIPEQEKGEFDQLLEDAHRLREGFEEFLDSVQFSDDGAWEALSRPWEGVANGVDEPFLVPAESGTTTVLELDDGTTVVNTGAGDDDVQVVRDPETGEVQVIVNGEVHPVSGPLIIRAGPGHNTVEVSPDVPVRLILGGRDADTIRAASPGTAIVALGGDDRVFGGPGWPGDERDNYLSLGGGNDYAEGGDGNDLIFGGMGGDTLYAGAGSDDVLPGEGSNYTDAGAGADRIFSRWEDHRDLDAGGPGEDLRTGGVGWEYHDRHDVIDPASMAVGSYPTEAGTSVVYLATDPPREPDHSWIKIEGSPEFVARVEADLHTLSRTYAAGGSLLDSGFRLSDMEQSRDPNWLPGQHSLTIREASETAPAATTESSSFLGNRSTVIHYNPVPTVGPSDPDATTWSPAAQLNRELNNESLQW